MSESLVERRRSLLLEERLEDMDCLVVLLKTNQNTTHTKNYILLEISVASGFFIGLDGFGVFSDLVVTLC